MGNGYLFTGGQSVRVTRAHLIIWLSFLSGCGDELSDITDSFSASFDTGIAQIIYLVLFLLAVANCFLLVQIINRRKLLKKQSARIKEHGADGWASELESLKAQVPEPLARALSKFNETVIQGRSTTHIKEFLTDKRAVDDIGLIRLFHFDSVRMLPSMMTTVGMLGTFFGVAAGLGHISGVDIGGEVGGVISGLSTAFLTSIIGLPHESYIRTFQ